LNPETTGHGHDAPSRAGQVGGHGHSHGLVARSVISSRAGVRAVSWSLLVLLITTLLQGGVFLLTGSVALLADLIHNFGDALTAVPLGFAFLMRSFTAEKRAGYFVVATIFVSACIALWQSIERLINPQDLDHLWPLAAAGVVGFIGNEIAAQIRTRAGRRLDSPAMIADGAHARTDGFVSLSVVASAILVALGLDIGDPIVGLVMTAVILRIHLAILPHRPARPRHRARRPPRPRPKPNHARARPRRPRTRIPPPIAGLRAPEINSTLQCTLGWGMTDDRCDLLCLDLPRAEVLRANVLDDERAGEFAKLAAGLADATRFRVASALAEGGELCVCDLAWITGRAENLVSHHLRHLRGAGLAVSRRQGKMVLYRLTVPGAALLESISSLGLPAQVAAE
jgi:DNA-binding transcriptional ArsR family regulator